MLNTKKKHYLILDGLRGVAALVVLVYHIFELHTTSKGLPVVGHGYIAVDFFFLLSGFVIAHAYDDRWSKQLTIKQFFKRRLIRLQPMVVFGMIFGAICYYFSASEITYPGVADMPVWKVLVTLSIAIFLIPMPKFFDIRGFGEMYPLNGPSWTLFFEYIANILYALILRRFTTPVLIFCTAVAAVAVMTFGVTTGDMVGGWSLTGYEVMAGMIRLLYPFLMGMLLRRLFKPVKIKQDGFILCSIILLVALLMPHFTWAQGWMNGLYESSVIIFLFPLLIFLGASGDLKSENSKKVCTFLGKISYPLYIVHYPIVYIFYGYCDQSLSIKDSIPMAIVVFFASIAVAYLAMKFYDAPVRKYLSKKFN